MTSADIHAKSLAHGLMLRPSHVMIQTRRESSLQMTNLCNHKVVNYICGPTCAHTRPINNVLDFPHEFDIEIAIVMFLSEIIPFCYTTRKDITQDPSSSNLSLSILSGLSKISRMASFQTYTGSLLYARSPGTGGLLCQCCLQ